MCICHLIVFIIYYLLLVVVRLFCSLFDFHLFFIQLLFSFDSLLFIVHCSKEKDSILILDHVPGISIPFNPLYVKFNQLLYKNTLTIYASQ